MGRNEAPGTSGSRVALDVAAAALDLIEAMGGEEDSARGVVARIETILRGGKKLMPYQADEVIDFLYNRADRGDAEPLPADDV